jgi:hypothetical protein
MASAYLFVMLAVTPSKSREVALIANPEFEAGRVAAVAFATKFYGGIASGQSLQSAFEQGRVAVEAVSLGESATPVLFTAKGENAKKLFLA